VQNKPIKSGHLTVFSLVMLTIGSVDSVRNLPTTALFGSTLIFFFLVAAIFFLIPCALVSAELASAWTEEGGIYVWVAAAFGKPIGFLAVWFQWIENVIWYPTILSFVAGTIAYVFAPQLANNQWFLVSVILLAFWGATVINLFGIKCSAWFSNFCSITGLLLPMAIIIVLGASWLILHKPLAISFAWPYLLPTLNQSTSWVALTGVVLSFCGMEIATVHARDVRDPQRAFPRALVIATAIILGTLILGSLSIAIVLPTQQISLVSGLMEAYDVFFRNYHIAWFLPIMGGMLIIGVMGSVSNWIIAPTRGLMIAAQDGHLPQIFRDVNRYGAPAKLLFCQAGIVTIVTLIFLCLPSVNGSYWFLTALASQLYMIMYIMMFITGIRLRYKAPTRHRSFRISKGHWGVWIISGMGILGASITFAIGFVPPSDVAVGALWQYKLLLILGLLIMSLPPFLVNAYQRYVKKNIE
jgi:glutamate:GABA antiporter